MDLLSQKVSKRIQCPVAWWSERHPQRSAIFRLGRKPIRYGQLHQRIRKMEQRLIAQGFAPGDRLMAVSANNLTMIILLWACWRQSIIFVPINPAFSLKQLLDIHHNILPHGYWAKDKNLQLPSQHLSLTTAPITVRGRAEIDLTVLADLIMTSGSTGTPKAIAHQFSQHLALARASQIIFPLGPGKSWLLALPLFHIGGIATLVRCMLTGAAVHLALNQSEINELIDEHRLTHLSLVPTQLSRLIKQQHLEVLKCKEVILLGGAPITLPLQKTCLKHALPVYVSYGLTEMSSQVCTSRLAPLQPLNCVGSTLPGVEIRLHNNRIYLRGPTRCTGYFKKGVLTPLVDWLETRDLGKFDEKGQLLMLGREDNMFISGGENIHPESLEQILLSYPNVDNAMIVPVEDAQWGQRPVAFIDTEVLDEQALSTWFRSQVSGYQQPVAWLPMPDEFRISNSEAALKVSRSQLQQIAIQILLARSSHSPTSGSR